MIIVAVVCATAVEDFSWHIVTDRDSDTVRAKKAEMALVRNQAPCKSCWAFAIADCLSDAYVINGIVSKRLELSPLYLYTMLNSLGICAEENGCNINVVIIYLANNNLTIAREDCLSFNTYYWQTQILSCGAVLPSKIGCATSGVYTTYGIRYDFKVDTNTETIQQSILTNGPIVISFYVDKHFKRGNFKATNGIYFETVATDFRHAMSVVGWGHEKINGTRVFFWWCRNSWGTRWGDVGYVKYAGSNKLNSLQGTFDINAVIKPGLIVSQSIPHHDTKIEQYVHVIVLANAFFLGMLIGVILVCIRTCTRKTPNSVEEREALKATV
jgi:hypothetical protein